ncbi:MAG: aminomethyltransferase family protein [Planctomycetota bacterium]|nr:aminomethyltransferase family protein [Planctomycetota bacterium]
MPLPTPFHPRTSALCTSYYWKDWAGYHAVCSFDICFEREYTAFRHAAGLLDVTPLFKTRISGPDAADFLSFVLTRDAQRLKDGQVAYSTWCDGAGKLIDDGTLARRSRDEFRLTSADPAHAHLAAQARGFNVELADETDQIAALSLQGPRSRVILAELGADTEETLRLEKLGFFRSLDTQLAGQDVTVTRTGYTGDLGYELWCAPDSALALWDALMETGTPHGLAAAGLDALDVTRIEAGFILNGIDYTSALSAPIESRKSTPLELGLGWTVHLDRAPFLGQAALAAERQRGPARRLVGLDADWDALEELFDGHDLAPELASGGWRSAVPVYANPEGERIQIGQATSGAWSPTLKQNLALATVRSAHAREGMVLGLEVTVEYERRVIPATVVRRPFYDPAHKRS